MLQSTGSQRVINMAEQLTNDMVALPFLCKNVKVP